MTAVLCRLHVPAFVIIGTSCISLSPRPQKFNLDPQPRYFSTRRTVYAAAHARPATRCYGPPRSCAAQESDRGEVGS
jgi:hypothetical protein